MAACSMVPYLLLLLVCGTVWGKERCCPDDKCYNDNPPFDNMPLPSCRDKVQPAMRLYTRNNPTMGQVVTRTTIPPAYMAGKPLVFVVHGYMQWIGIWWMDDIRDAFFHKYDYNIILVNWPKGSIKGYYPQSASNTRVVGAEIAHVVRHLVARGVADRNTTWCTGHSLGSHTCGHAGQNYKLGRVTGMDPAGPWFQDKDLSVGINPSVADFVDIWHTNGDTALIMGFGTLRELGHVDFYPNGGGFQKGCLIDPYSRSGTLHDKYLQLDPSSMNESLPENMTGSPQVDLMPFCSHMRAVALFAEAVESDCQMYARHFCVDESNIPESCFECEGEDGVCGVMGMDADKYDLINFPLYMPTNGGKPFCMG